MIQHIVQFNLKAEVTVADRDWLFEQIKGMRKIPAVKRLQVGKLLGPCEEWYKPRLNQEYQWSVMIDFDNEDDLYVYQKSGHHEEVAGEIRKRVDGPLRIVDFVSQ